MGGSSLAVGSEHDVRFTDLLANGQGVGRIGGLVVFVWGALPEESGRVRISEVKKTYAVGELIGLVESSPARTVPFCPVFGTCGGCQVQHLSYAAQLEWKSRLVRDALERIGGLADVRVRPTLGMTLPRNYRNKMALVVDHRADAVDFGFYQMRSHAFVSIEGCPVVLPQLNEQIGVLQTAAQNPSNAAAFRAVNHVIARAGAASGESVLALTTDKRRPELQDLATHLAEQLPGVAGISNSFEPASTNAVLGRKHAQLWGQPELEERIGDARYRVSAASFFQVNSAMVAHIFERLSERRSAPHRVVDLYCGAGTFAIFFALRGAAVVGVEENPAAVREAHGNADLNGVTQRTRFLCGRVESVLARPEGRSALEAADFVFLDPPRKGCDPHALDALTSAKTPEIWYLSCNPATLARDLAQLCEGYRLVEAQPFDLFPQTGHVETLAFLRRSDLTEPA